MLPDKVAPFKLTFLPIIGSEYKVTGIQASITDNGDLLKTYICSGNQVIICGQIAMAQSSNNCRAINGMTPR